MENSLAAHIQSVEKAAEAITSSSTNDLVAYQAKTLRLHLSLREEGGSPLAANPPDPPPAFFVESAPNASRAASCKLVTCGEPIPSGSYRIAVHPAMMGAAWHASKNAGESSVISLLLPQR